jgi:hypothetical protein
MRMSLTTEEVCQKDKKSVLTSGASRWLIAVDIQLQGCLIVYKENTSSKQGVAEAPHILRRAPSWTTRSFPILWRSEISTEQRQILTLISAHT